MHDSISGASHAFGVWSLMLMALWLLVYIGIRSPAGRTQMLKCSVFTLPLGLTEPFFVPEYWNPPTLFDLAQRTGFDLESLVFAFAVGGLAGSLYELLVPLGHSPVSDQQRHHPRHRWHRLALTSPALVFLALYPVKALNPIYTVIASMLIGGILTVCCRPDLLAKMLGGALLFGTFYFLFFLTLVGVHPDYVARVWNLEALSGVLVLGVPLEEILFALTLGFLWSGAYEHLLWFRADPVRRDLGP